MLPSIGNHVLLNIAIWAKPCFKFPKLGLERVCKGFEKVCGEFEGGL